MLKRPHPPKPKTQKTLSKLQLCQCKKRHRLPCWKYSTTMPSSPTLTFFGSLFLADVSFEIALWSAEQTASKWLIDSLSQRALKLVMDSRWHLKSQKVSNMMPKKETRACENKHIFTVDRFIYWEKWLERLEEKPPISAIASQKNWQVSNFLWYICKVWPWENKHIFILLSKLLVMIFFGGFWEKHSF